MASKMISCSPSRLPRLLHRASNLPRPTSDLSQPRHHQNQLRRHASSTSTQHVDPTEVSHFNSLASSWWDPHGPSRILHLMNPLRHSFITTCLNSQPRSTDTPTSDTVRTRRYLDIGCGGGIFAESAARLPSTASVTAIDPSENVIAVARAHARRDPLLASCASQNDHNQQQQHPPRLTYHRASIQDLPIPTSYAHRHDLVTIFEVLEHVPSPSAFLDAATKHVRPGGWIILSTIARTWTSWAVTKVVAEDVMGVVPRGTHDWAKYVNPEELRDWFAGRKGWEEPVVRGVVYVPGWGWREVAGSEDWGNYFFGVRKSMDS